MKTALEIITLTLTPLTLLLFAFFQIEQSAALTLIVACACILLSFAGFEKSRPPLRQIVPTCVMGALAAAGRILFAAIPDFKPVSAICIISGVVFGRRSGFITGCLAALVSNFFFGQGPWTPWQMYSWGLIGYLAGVFNSCGFFKYRGAIYVWGALAPLLYGFLLNSWYIVGFVHPITWQAAFLAYGAGLPLDLIHAAATVIFLAALYEPWKTKLQRIRQKYLALS